MTSSFENRSRYTKLLIFSINFYLVIVRKINVSRDRIKIANFDATLLVSIRFYKYAFFCLNEVNRGFFPNVFHPGGWLPEGKIRSRRNDFMAASRSNGRLYLLEINARVAIRARFAPSTFSRSLWTPERLSGVDGVTSGKGFRGEASGFATVSQTSLSTPRGHLSVLRI